MTASNGTTVERLAGFVNATTFDTLPASVVGEVKRLLLDSFGCALAGVSSDKGRWALEFVRAAHTGTQATVLGCGERSSVLGAAFVNGELINGLDFDASGKPGHVPPFVIPAALAVAELQKASGKELLTACALAHEVSNRIGGAMSSFRDINHDKISWPLVTGYSCTIFGGAAAVAKLEHFSEDRLAHALGMAGHLAPMQTQSAWINNLPPTTAKYLMAGWMNQSAITAAYLVKAGHRGNLAVLDGDYGFWRFAGSAKWNADSALAGLGQEWRFPRETTYKQYPVCRIMHGALDGLAAIIELHKLRPDEIEHIHAWLEASCVQPVFGIRNIENQVDAQFSVPYGMAVTALGIPPGARWQAHWVMHSAQIRELMDKVTFEPHPRYVDALKNNPKARPSRIEVSARGQTFAEEREYIKGTPTSDPATSLSDDELIAKFKHNAAGVLSVQKINQASERIMALEDLSDVGSLMALLCP